MFLNVDGKIFNICYLLCGICLSANPAPLVTVANAVKLVMPLANMYKELIGLSELSQELLKINCVFISIILTWTAGLSWKASSRT